MACGWLTPLSSRSSGEPPCSREHHVDVESAHHPVVRPDPGVELALFTAFAIASALGTCCPVARRAASVSLTARAGSSVADT